MNIENYQEMYFGAEGAEEKLFYLGQWYAAAGTICKSSSPLNPQIDKGLASSILSSVQKALKHYKAIDIELSNHGDLSCADEIGQLEQLAFEIDQIIGQPQKASNFSYD
jgi:hypothetical protein